jgi:uncharacterized membrane-anchored protein
MFGLFGIFLSHMLLKRRQDLGICVLRVPVVGREEDLATLRAPIGNRLILAAGHHEAGIFVRHKSPSRGANSVEVLAS